MNLIKFDPFARTSAYLPNLFDNFFNARMTDMTGSDFINNVPAVNIAETEKEYMLQIAVPGLKKEDVKVSVAKNLLTISSEATESSESGEGKWMRREFSFRAFRRSFEIPETVDRDRITARYENGILQVTVPKKAEIVKEAKSRMIEIA